MEIKVKVPDEVAAQAQARGVKVEAYVEEILARQAGARRLLRCAAPNKFVRGSIRSHNSPIKFRPFPRTFPANGFTRITSSLEPTPPACKKRLNTEAAEVGAQRTWRPPTPPGVLYGCEKKGFAGKGICI